MFMPFGPQTPGSAGSGIFGIGGYRCTRIRLTRQVIVDAKNPNLRAQTASIVQRELGRDGTPTLNGPFSSSSEMWDMTTIGEGTFDLFVSELFCPLSPPSEEYPFSCGLRALLNSSVLLHPSIESWMLLCCYGPLLIHDTLCSVDDGTRARALLVRRRVWLRGAFHPVRRGGVSRITDRIGSLSTVRYLFPARLRYLGSRPQDYSLG